MKAEIFTKILYISYDVKLHLAYNHNLLYESTSHGSFFNHRWFNIFTYFHQEVKFEEWWEKC